MSTIDFILESFTKDIKSQGLFWRISRQNTFVDLLMLEAHKAANKGIDMDLAVNIVIISLKAIINYKYETLDSTLEFKQLNAILVSEKERILHDITNILVSSLLNNSSTNSVLFDDLNYFKVLNNLRIDNISIQVFENILNPFVFYINSKNKI